MTTKYLCTQEDEGRKLYGILRRELALSLTQLRRIKPAGGIFVNGSPAHTDYRVKPGDLVQIQLQNVERAPDLIPQEGALEVLYESEGLLIANKPCGLLVHPSRSQQLDTLANYAWAHILSSSPAAACHVVNRLDRDTSGAVLIAKSARMKNLLSKAMGTDSAVKEYIALVHGAFAPSGGVINHKIKRLREGSMLRTVAPDGQDAVTLYDTLDIFDGYSVVKFRLLTGRTHQIRVHCSTSGHPILGDGLYYSEASAALSAAMGINAQALHAFHLAFSEPQSGEQADILAPIRRDDLEQLNKYISSYR